MVGSLPSGCAPGMMEASFPHSLHLCGPNFLVARLVLRLLPLGLLLIGPPLVRGDEHLVMRRTTAGFERLFRPSSVGGTRGFPCPDAGRILGFAPVQGLFATRILGQHWNPLEIGVVVANFDWLLDHPSEIRCCEDGLEATGWPKSWEGPKIMGVKQMQNWIKVLCCCSVRPLSSPTPPFYWQGTHEGVGEMWEFELITPGRRTR
jgi:hypothetical protein